eukprot:TRINITY_DN2607_c0_g1_i1.p1 TRINITY_DN2607_c0_g1~~TRINITY_DN2607_c0_g1_i1.p1  ORF type:complete len:661 (+),score=149.89 TRINITY_DN2607_c0_g1_i1:106-2088(+)
MASRSMSRVSQGTNNSSVRTKSRKESRSQSRPQGGKNKIQMSTQVLLMRRGLEGYYHYMEKAGYKFVETGVYCSDQHAEQMLAHVEEVNNVKFEPAVRAELWKCFRYEWFQSYGHDREFVHRGNVPALFLPKLGYREVESGLGYHQLDGDRQRQIVRTKRRYNAHGRGVMVETRQFEVYKREPDMFYVYKDLKKCVKEWSEKNPRTMVREDPREEVLKIRIRAVMESTCAHMMMRQAGVKRQTTLMVALWLLRFFLILMSALMFYLAYVIYADIPRQLVFYYMFGSHQFRAGTSYFIAFWFAHVVINRRHADLRLVRLRKMLVSLERLNESIDDFRLESEDYRIADMEARAKEIAFAAMEAQRAEKQAAALSKPKKRKKKEKTPAEKAEQDMLLAWGGADDMKKGKICLDLAGIDKMIQLSKMRLPDLPDNFRRPGGNRMLIDRHNPTSMNEDEDDYLCVRSTAGNKAELLGITDPPIELIGPRPESRHGSRRTGSYDSRSASRASRSLSRDLPPSRMGSRKETRHDSRKESRKDSRSVRYAEEPEVADESKPLVVRAPSRDERGFPLQSALKQPQRSRSHNEQPKRSGSLPLPQPQQFGRSQSRPEHHAVAVRAQSRPEVSNAAPVARSGRSGSLPEHAQLGRDRSPPALPGELADDVP